MWQVCCGEDPGGRHWVVQLINGKEIVVLLIFFPKIQLCFSFALKMWEIYITACARIGVA